MGASPDGGFLRFAVHCAANPQKSYDDFLDMAHVIGLNGSRSVLLVGVLNLATVLDLLASMGRQLALSLLGVVKSNEKVRYAIVH